MNTVVPPSPVKPKRHGFYVTIIIVIVVIIALAVGLFFIFRSKKKVPLTCPNCPADQFEIYCSNPANTSECVVACEDLDLGCEYRSTCFKLNKPQASYKFAKCDPCYTNSENCNLTMYCDTYAKSPEYILPEVNEDCNGECIIDPLSIHCSTEGFYSTCFAENNKDLTEACQESCLGDMENGTYVFEHGKEYYTNYYDGKRKYPCDIKGCSSVDRVKVYCESCPNNHFVNCDWDAYCSIHKNECIDQCVLGSIGACSSKIGKEWCISNNIPIEENCQVDGNCITGDSCKLCGVYDTSTAVTLKIKSDTDYSDYYLYYQPNYKPIDQVNLKTNYSQNMSQEVFNSVQIVTQSQKVMLSSQLPIINAVSFQHNKVGIVYVGTDEADRPLYTLISYDHTNLALAYDDAFGSSILFTSILPTNSFSYKPSELNNPIFQWYIKNISKTSSNQFYFFPKTSPNKVLFIRNGSLVCDYPTVGKDSKSYVNAEISLEFPISFPRISGCQKRSSDFGTSLDFITDINSSTYFNSQMYACVNDQAWDNPTNKTQPRLNWNPAGTGWQKKMFISERDCKLTMKLNFTGEYPYDKAFREEYTDTQLWLSRIGGSDNQQREFLYDTNGVEIKFLQESAVMYMLFKPCAFNKLFFLIGMRYGVEAKKGQFPNSILGTFNPHINYQQEVVNSNAEIPFLLWNNPVTPLWNSYTDGNEFYNYIGEHVPFFTGLADSTNSCNVLASTKCIDMPFKC